MLGTHAQFQPTSCTTQLAFLADSEAGRPDKLRPDVVRYLETQLGSGSVRGGVLGKVSLSITFHLILRKARSLHRSCLRTVMNKTGQGGDKRRHSSGSGPGVSISLTGSMKRSRSICPDQVPSHWSPWSRDRSNPLPLARHWCGRCRGSWPRSQGSPPSAAAAAPGTANIPPLFSYTMC